MEFFASVSSRWRVLTLAILLASCTRGTTRVDLCQGQNDPKCIRNNPVPATGEPRGADREACPSGSMKTPQGCEDGARYCASKGLDFSGSECMECPGGSTWHNGQGQCVAEAEAPAPVAPQPGGLSPTEPPRPTYAPEPGTPMSPSQSPSSTSEGIVPRRGAPPEVELKVVGDGKLRVQVKFADTAGVSKAKVEIGANTVATVRATHSANDDGFLITALAIPVRVTFTLGTKTCSVVGDATEAGSGPIKPTGC